MLNGAKSRIATRLYPAVSGELDEQADPGRSRLLPTPTHLLHPQCIRGF